MQCSQASLAEVIDASRHIVELELGKRDYIVPP